MVHWLYDIPDWLLGTLVVGGTIGVAIAGFVATRGWRQARTPLSNDAAGAALNAVSLIYGIVLALIAVAAWNNYTAASDATEREAAALTNLYRVVQGYPEPARQRLETQVGTYVGSLLADEWPAVQRGQTSVRTGRALDALVRGWAAFEPGAERERLLHSSTWHELDAVLDARRSRLTAGQAGLPGPLWAVVLLGAVITIGSMHVLRMQNERAHLVLTVATGTVLGLVIFVIVVLDHPLWGKQGLGPEPIAEASRMITTADR
jgi:hypothetical protein